MNTKFLLDQILGAGGDPAKFSTSKDVLSSLISNKGGAALAGGALGLLIGSKSGRKMGGKVLSYGGLAILGTLAYKAFQNYQQETKQSLGQSAQPLHQLTNQAAETHCKVILIALIAAAKADGHIDERERQLIDTEIRKMTTDPELHQWFDRELKKPLDPAEVASHAKDKSMACEMYLASLLVVDQQNFMEKSYIEELARQLQLEAGLQNQLAEEVRKALVTAN